MTISRRRRPLHFLVGMLALLVFAPVGLSGYQSAQAWSDTHYGYVVAVSADLNNANNLCNVARTSTTAIAVPFSNTDDPLHLYNCLNASPSISTIVLRPQHGPPNDFATLDAWFQKSWRTSGNPKRWINMPTLFPNRNFILEIGNEPVLEWDAGPWTEGFYVKDSVIRLYDKYRPTISNLHYMPALGVGTGADGERCIWEGSEDYCDMEIVQVLVEGYDICRLGGKAWGCSFHRYWWHQQNGFAGGGPLGGGANGKAMYDYVIASPLIPRLMVSEQGIDANPIGDGYTPREDCHLRLWTKNNYPQKVRVALTYVVAMGSPGPRDWDTFGIDSTSDIMLPSPGCPST